ncbi:MAG: serine/threonine protein phosphatase [Archaeoglobales archaeon]|jgi:predicted phosphodiesterase|nr:serine/threonine protein phosphatase [Archaeoglobus sp.]NHW89122.1 serine/threonine protein phosphatase [Archaeoglobales archaeon]
MDLLELIDEARNLMKVKMLEIQEDTCTIIGDIHADIEALEKIEKEIEGKAIFLGDYADRGDYPMEVYERILSMFVDGKAYLLRGNHETEEVYPHELPWQLSGIENGEEIYESLKELWEKMPVSAILNGEIFLVHGGVPCGDLKKSSLENPSEEIALELMWNDPWERDECGENFKRGVMYFFGKKATKRLFENLGTRLVIRSHEPYKILKVEQEGMLITVGSCANPYGLANFAILKYDSRTGFRDGWDFVRKFGIEFSV